MKNALSTKYKILKVRRRKNDLKSRITKLKSYGTAYEARVTYVFWHSCHGHLSVTQDCIFCLKLFKQI